MPLSHSQSTSQENGDVQPMWGPVHCQGMGNPPSLVMGLGRTLPKAFAVLCPVSLGWVPWGFA